MSFGEESSSNYLLITIPNSESHSGQTNAFLTLHNRPEIQIVEAPSLWENSGIKYPDDNIKTVVRFRPQTSIGSLRWSNRSRESVKNGVVNMEDAIGFSELGSVPLVMIREN
ncbi:hypothetical protein L1987_57949 [Smallanthus sonchifolius]|uniref:Uncharacterized protein n=1 Tax=Smallanthus sonchifolius TaxID=185202 RepID=A0ACB9DEF2_9ASTR|nr:hypothetical protein L1987_57949 [Smallanthus sonchifolius]